ncbi:MAG: hypothetical protein EU539_02815 [Promethearchaeota archaeon]|nr:MAG: hypothetical protein EU539_02815 [Candidatus Lokiarchaeota archaeon]
MGKSKKHHIFKAKRWSTDFEKIYKKPVFNKEYKKLGQVKEIFGPINLPFISIKTLKNEEFNPDNEIYVKV